jgi:5-methylcytosine-specific restriction endonuclease McrA
MALRKPCVQCGQEIGYIQARNGQQVVYCSACDRYQYCAPKSETGLPQRSVSNRPLIKPSQRARIIDRDNGTCAVCNRADGVMHIGHLLSVDDGRKVGATDEELWSDENLAVMCEECNLGFGNLTVSLRLVYRVLQIRLRRNRPRLLDGIEDQP